MKKAKINELRKVASWWGDTLSAALPGLATYGIARGLGAGNGLALALGAGAGGAGLYAKKKWLDPAWDAAELEANAREERAALTAAAKEYEEREAREAATDEAAAREAAEGYEAREAISRLTGEVGDPSLMRPGRVIHKLPTPKWMYNTQIYRIMNPAGELADFMPRHVNYDTSPRWMMPLPPENPRRKRGWGWK